MTPILVMILLIPISVTIAIVFNYIFYFKKINENQNSPPIEAFEQKEETFSNLEVSKSNSSYEVEDLINKLNDMIEKSNYILEASEKKNTVKAINRTLQGLFSFINGNLENYSKKNVEYLFEEIEDIFKIINYKLIIPLIEDNFDQSLMIIKGFENTEDESKVNKVFKTNIIGYKNVNENTIDRKAEVIVYKKE